MSLKLDGLMLCEMSCASVFHMWAAMSVVYVLVQVCIVLLLGHLCCTRTCSEKGVDLVSPYARMERQQPAMMLALGRRRTERGV